MIEMVSKIEDGYNVTLTTEDNTYVVIYGSETMFTACILKAYKFYKECIDHQLNCSGLLVS